MEAKQIKVFFSKSEERFNEEGRGRYVAGKVSNTDSESKMHTSSVLLSLVLLEGKCTHISALLVSQKDKKKGCKVTLE